MKILRLAWHLHRLAAFIGDRTSFVFGFSVGDAKFGRVQESCQPAISDIVRLWNRHEAENFRRDEMQKIIERFAVELSANRFLLRQISGVDVSISFDVAFVQKFLPVIHPHLGNAFEVPADKIDAVKSAELVVASEDVRDPRTRTLEQFAATQP